MLQSTTAVKGRDPALTIVGTGQVGREQLWTRVLAVGLIISVVCLACGATPINFWVPTTLSSGTMQQISQAPRVMPLTVVDGASGMHEILPVEAAYVDGNDQTTAYPSATTDEPQGWSSTLVNFGSALCVAAAGLTSMFLGRTERQKAQDERTDAQLQASEHTNLTWTMAAVSDASQKQNDSLKFMVGLGWFFAHQLIGVGNDVIMKFVGGNLAVAQIVFLRFAFATLTMLPFMIASGPEAFRTNRLPLHIARSVLLAGGIGMYCTGLTIAPIAVVTTLNFTIPLFTLVLSRIFLKEKVGPLRWCATLAGFAGVMVVLQPAQMAFNPQWMVVLCGAAMFSSLDVLNKYFVGKESFWAMIFYTALFTAGLSAYPAAQVWAPVTGMQLKLLAMLGAGANLLLYCLLKSFSLVDASALAPFRYTELLFSALVGFLLFAEVPALTTLLGAGVIIPSTLFVVWQESKGNNDASDAQLDVATA